MFLNAIDEGLLFGEGICWSFGWGVGEGREGGREGEWVSEWVRVLGWEGGFVRVGI